MAFLMDGLSETFFLEVTVAVALTLCCDLDGGARPPRRSTATAPSKGLRWQTFFFNQRAVEGLAMAQNGGGGAAPEKDYLLSLCSLCLQGLRGGLQSCQNAHQAPEGGAHPVFGGGLVPLFLVVDPSRTSRVECRMRHLQDFHERLVRETELMAKRQSALNKALTVCRTGGRVGGVGRVPCRRIRRARCSARADMGPGVRRSDVSAFRSRWSPTKRRCPTSSNSSKTRSRACQPPAHPPPPSTPPLALSIGVGLCAAATRSKEPRRSSHA